LTKHKLKASNLSVVTQTIESALADFIEDSKKAAEYIADSEEDEEIEGSSGQNLSNDINGTFFLLSLIFMIHVQKLLDLISKK
jgi:hypothetical protein